MGVHRALPLALGTLAVSSGLAMLTFDIIFAVVLSRDNSQHSAGSAAIVASSLGGVSDALLLTLLVRQIRYRNGAHIQDFGHGRRNTYLLAGTGGVIGILSAVAAALTLGVMSGRLEDLPKIIIASPTTSLVAGAFVVWAISLLSQAMFVICMVVIQRKNFHQEIQPYRSEPESEMFPQMQKLPRAQTENAQADVDNQRGQSSMESRTPPSSSGRSRAGSDTMSSFRSSLSQVVRPITSKTRLIQAGHRSPHHRPTSIDSNHREISQEDGFDSWDTSAVDGYSRQAVESASPTPQRFLETIPASPTGSRSPSPGFPLDLDPPKMRKRSRSYSPATSQRERARSSRATSPLESPSEAHIHPLFRSDSPTPAPAATPGTVVTAAPNAGQLISDRASIRSIHRMRSGSLPSSPLMHTDSLDDIRRAMEREEIERLENGGERTLTPPIPDFILNGGPRNSLSGYNARKKTPTGLGIVGEIREG
ncbi:hypothetical protein B0J14DRAFT_648130 [Halenospora varia]|nr:hypothetical protein B0J14DRAFT_648130 [Halenospora varia]